MMFIFYCTLLGIERDWNLTLSEYYKQTGLKRGASKVQRLGSITLNISSCKFTLCTPKCWYPEIRNQSRAKLWGQNKYQIICSVGLMNIEPAQTPSNAATPAPEERISPFPELWTSPAGHAAPRSARTWIHPRAAGWHQKHCWCRVPGLFKLIPAGSRPEDQRFGPFRELQRPAHQLNLKCLSYNT